MEEIKMNEKELRQIKLERMRFNLAIRAMEQRAQFETNIIVYMGLFVGFLIGSIMLCIFL